MSTSPEHTGGTVHLNGTIATLFMIAHVSRPRYALFWLGMRPTTWNAGYEEMQSTQQLSSLSNRRLFLKLCTIFKVIHGMCYFPPHVIFLPGVPGLTSVDLSCSLNLSLELLHIFTHLFLTLSANGIVYRNMWISRRTGSVSRTGSTIYNEITRDYVNIVHGEAVWTL